MSARIRLLEGLEKNAQKLGFRVRERKDIFSSEHYVAGLRSTRDVMLGYSMLRKVTFLHSMNVAITTTDGDCSG